MIDHSIEHEGGKLHPPYVQAHSLFCNKSVKVSSEAPALPLDNSQGMAKATKQP